MSNFGPVMSGAFVAHAIGAGDTSMLSLPQRRREFVRDISLLPVCGRIALDAIDPDPFPAQKWR
jgi:hypothetical protein